MRSVARSRGGRRGQAMLESGLILSTLLILLIGLLDFGQVMFVHQSLVNRARMGARYGSVNFANLEQVQYMVVYGSTTAPAPDGGGTLPPGYLDLTTAMVSVTRSGVNTNDDRIIVRISNYPFQFFTPWIFKTLTMAPITASYPVEAS